METTLSKMSLLPHPLETTFNGENLLLCSPAVSQRMRKQQEVMQIVTMAEKVPKYLFCIKSPDKKEQYITNLIIICRQGQSFPNQYIVTRHPHPWGNNTIFIKLVIDSRTHTCQYMEIPTCNRRSITGLFTQFTC